MFIFLRWFCLDTDLVFKFSLDPDQDPVLVPGSWIPDPDPRRFGIFMTEGSGPGSRSSVLPGSGLKKL